MQSFPMDLTLMYIMTSYSVRLPYPLFLRFHCTCSLFHYRVCSFAPPNIDIIDSMASSSVTEMGMLCAQKF